MSQSHDPAAEPFDLLEYLANRSPRPSPPPERYGMPPHLPPGGMGGPLPPSHFGAAPAHWTAPAHDAAPMAPETVDLTYSPPTAPQEAPAAPPLLPFIVSMAHVRAGSPLPQLPQFPLELLEGRRAPPPSAANPEDPSSSGEDSASDASQASEFYGEPINHVADVAEAAMVDDEEEEDEEASEEEHKDADVEMAREEDVDGSAVESDDENDDDDSDVEIRSAFAQDNGAEAGYDDEDDEDVEAEEEEANEPDAVVSELDEQEEEKEQDEEWTPQPPKRRVRRRTGAKVVKKEKASKKRRRPSSNGVALDGQGRPIKKKTVVRGGQQYVVWDGESNREYRKKGHPRAGKWSKEHDTLLCYLYIIKGHSLDHIRQNYEAFKDRSASAMSQHVPICMRRHHWGDSSPAGKSRWRTYFYDGREWDEEKQQWTGVAVDNAAKAPPMPASMKLKKKGKKQKKKKKASARRPRKAPASRSKRRNARRRQPDSEEEKEEEEEDDDDNDAAPPTFDAMDVDAQPPAALDVGSGSDSDAASRGDELGGPHLEPHSALPLMESEEEEEDEEDGDLDVGALSPRDEPADMDVDQGDDEDEVDDVRPREVVFHQPFSDEEGEEYDEEYDDEYDEDDDEGEPPAKRRRLTGFVRPAARHSQPDKPWLDIATIANLDIMWSKRAMRACVGTFDWPLDDNDCLSEFKRDHGFAGYQLTRPHGVLYLRFVSDGSYYPTEDTARDLLLALHNNGSDVPSSASRVWMHVVDRR